MNIHRSVRFLDLLSIGASDPVEFACVLLSWINSGDNNAGVSYGDDIVRFSFEQLGIDIDSEDNRVLASRFSEQMSSILIK